MYKKGCPLLGGCPFIGGSTVLCIVALCTSSLTMSTTLGTKRQARLKVLTLNLECVNQCAQQTIPPQATR